MDQDNTMPGNQKGHNMRTRSQASLLSEGSELDTENIRSASVASFGSVNSRPGSEIRREDRVEKLECRMDKVEAKLDSLGTKMDTMMTMMMELMMGQRQQTRFRDTSPTSSQGSRQQRNSEPENEPINGDNPRCYRRPPDLSKVPEIDEGASYGEWQRWKSLWEANSVNACLSTYPRKQQVNALRLVLGPALHEVVETICEIMWDNADTTVEKVLQGLQEFFRRTTNVNVSRDRLNKRKQGTGETIDQYYLAMAKIARECELGHDWRSHVASLMVTGCRSRKAQERLLEGQQKRHLDEVLDICRAVEQAERNIQALESTDEDSIHRVRSGYKKRQDFQRQKGDPCDACGDHHWVGGTCPAQNRRCFRCGTQGHFEVVCSKEPVRINTVLTGPIPRGGRDEDVGSDISI